MMRTLMLVVVGSLIVGAAIVVHGVIVRPGKYESAAASLTSGLVIVLDKQSGNVNIRELYKPVKR